MRRALVFGGSGAVGSEVVRALAVADVPTVFTYHAGQARAEALSKELGAQALQLDLRDEPAIRACVEGLEEAPDVFVHCAGLSGSAPLAEVDAQLWNDVMAVNCHAAFLAVQALAPRLENGGDVVLLGALDRGQSLPLPPAFAASQGALGALAMSLAKELGPQKLRVNMLALGVLEGGLSRDISAKTLQDYDTFSALQRRGTPAEAADAVLWLALENTYMNGKVLPINGGV